STRPEQRGQVPANLLAFTPAWVGTGAVGTGTGAGTTTVSSEPIRASRKLASRDSVSLPSDRAVLRAERTAVAKDGSSVSHTTRAARTASASARPDRTGEKVPAAGPSHSQQSPSLMIGVKWREHRPSLA